MVALRRINTVRSLAPINGFMFRSVSLWSRPMTGRHTEGLSSILGPSRDNSMAKNRTTRRLLTRHAQSETFLPSQLATSSIHQPRSTRSRYSAASSNKSTFMSPPYNRSTQPYDKMRTKLQKLRNYLHILRDVDRVESTSQSLRPTAITTADV
jgi:hypothetical protein